ncbi:nucleotidyltransferase family protein [Pseudomonas sp. Y24-6]|uniref:nucleotidyltransferase family protein n=1 Tax=Pseudomonas sp. Y24-6 TaxID=2750013 RepID=UPI001CE067D4|nr:nucleotidyltransferase family protein [Pseudomonas sp. Y24-6]MCA4965573.1 nucleotidyltransferase family protein [Pseudomonas sp. Y24-6]
MVLTPDRLMKIARTNPANVEILERLPALGLKQCMLTAGCLFQAVWNHHDAKPAAWGIKDYDVFYFDQDLSWEAENEVILAAEALFQDLDLNIEIKNQARVHLWYGERFGEVYAPYGLDDIEQGLLRINPVNHQFDLFEKKALSYQARWPWLEIVYPAV